MKNWPQYDELEMASLVCWTSWPATVVGRQQNVLLVSIRVTLRAVSQRNRRRNEQSHVHGFSANPLDGIDKNNQTTNRKTIAGEDRRAITTNLRTQIYGKQFSAAAVQMLKRPLRCSNRQTGKCWRSIKVPQQNHLRLRISGFWCWNTTITPTVNQSINATHPAASKAACM